MSATIICTQSAEDLSDARKEIAGLMAVGVWDMDKLDSKSKRINRYCDICEDDERAEYKLRLTTKYTQVIRMCRLCHAVIYDQNTIDSRVTNSNDWKRPTDEETA